MKKIIILFITAMLFALTSCKDNMTAISNPDSPEYIAEADKSFEGEMLALWEGINQSYVFWETDKTDWDAKRDEMIALGKELDNLQNTGMLEWDNENKDLIDKIAAPFIGLIDHHMGITIVNPYILDEKKRQDEAIDVSPAEYEVKTRPYYHQRIPFTVYMNSFVNVLGSSRYTDLVATTYKQEDGGKIDIISALIDGCIPYLHMSGYNMDVILKDEESKGALALTTYYENIKQLKQSGKLKAVILDNRGNGGGAVADLDYVAGLFMENTEVAMYNRTKNGLGKYDFANVTSQIVNPNTSSPYYVGDLGNVPYVVLQDLYSISMGEMSTNFISRMPNAVTVGERTYGGHGTLFTSNTYEQNGYNGSFNQNRNGHSVYTTNTESELFNKKTNEWRILEGYGVEPDIECIVSDATLSGKDDNQLMRALQYIYQK
ncbi:MAG: S41 family peptidase [Bacteroidales bacterium]|nr:S41 family peptidase [Bacteroidales bacterium]